MRRVSLSAVFLMLALGATPALAQEAKDKKGAAPAAASDSAANVQLDEIIRKTAQSESTVLTNLKAFKPIVEVYLQSVTTNEALVVTPTMDSYVLGRFDWKKGPKLLALSGSGSASRLSTKNGGRSMDYAPDGFASLIAPDWDTMDAKRYAFTLVRREFVGETRCFVIDVKPIKSLKDGFSGRIWVEDRDYNIVRFKGMNRRTEREAFRQDMSLDVDGWRTNVLPGLWLPSYVYVEETEPDQSTPGSTRGPHVRSQVRLWGYDPRKSQQTSAFTDVVVEGSQVQDNANQQGQLSPVLSARQWETEAEANVLERLEKAGLISTPGEVEKVLETVLNNLEVTNDLSFNQPVKARVLLTTPLESFTVGHTIVLSRGLIDVLPDEASLAMMLGHELAHIALGHALIDPQFAFPDRLMVTDEQLLKLLKMTRTPKEEAEADNKVIEMLGKSPYKDKLSDSGLFLKMVGERARVLPNLIQPHIGDHIAQGGQIMRLAELMQAAPQLDANKLDQVAALAMGARLVLDPWSSRLELLRNAAQLPASAREKVPLAVSPLIPYVKYTEAPPVFKP